MGHLLEGLGVECDGLGECRVCLCRGCDESGVFEGVGVGYSEGERDGWEGEDAEGGFEGKLRVERCM